MASTIDFGEVHGTSASRTLVIKFSKFSVFTSECLRVLGLFCQTIPFTLQELTALKKQAMEDGVLSKASTFEAVSGHVWQARTKALELEPTHVATLMYAVDIRKRLQPNLPAEFCGNGVYSACAR
jgi:hypothetical protein